jgi:hypothetical protein
LNILGGCGRDEAWQRTWEYDCKRRDPSFVAFHAQRGIIFGVEMERDEFGRVLVGLVEVYMYVKPCKRRGNMIFLLEHLFVHQGIVLIM